HTHTHPQTHTQTHTHTHTHTALPATHSVCPFCLIPENTGLAASLHAICIASLVKLTVLTTPSGSHDASHLHASQAGAQPGISVSKLGLVYERDVRVHTMG